MITLPVPKSEQSFFKNRVFAIPQCNGKTQVLKKIRNAANAIFAPDIRAKVCMIEREIIPCITIFAVIFPHSPPLPFTQVWPPFSYGRGFQIIFGKPFMFRLHVIDLTYLYPRREIKII